MTYLLKPGELALKGGNRASFEYILKRNLSSLLRGTGAHIEMTHGRFYVYAPEGKESDIERALGHLFGIAGWAKVRTAAKDIAAIYAAAIAEAQVFFEEGLRTFKVNARRTDKSFPVDSNRICADVGESILAAIPGLNVDIHKPQNITKERDCFDK